MAASSRHNNNPLVSVQQVDLARADETLFSRRCVGCIVLTKDNKILLQQRDHNSPTYPDRLATFGGGIDPGETPIQALVRELKEELGAEVKIAEVISLGAITEEA
jgi:8-oxo-dGTP diphosphatase